MKKPIETTEKTEVTAEQKQQKSGGSFAAKLFIAALFTFFGGVLMISVVWTVIHVFVPWLSVEIFRGTGIVVAEGLTFSEFSVGDITVMVMTWLLPSLAATGIVTLASWSFMKLGLRFIKKLWKNAFASRKAQTSEVK